MPEDSIVYDTENAYLWDQISRYYDAGGQLAARLTVFDNGIFRDEVFFDGIRSETVERDTGPEGGVRIWDTTTTYFDQGGDIVARVTDFDNGNTREELFNNGVRERTTDIDVDDGQGGNANWASVDTYFDQGGGLVARVTHYDTGATREELFSNGFRERTTEMDVDDGQGGVHNWQDLTTYYNEGGELVARVTNYDDGGLREELFSNGLRDRTIQTDSIEGGTGSYAWSQISTYYDQGGVIAARVMALDNGVTREDIYQDGVRIETVETDDSQGSEAVTWANITTLYENGDRVLRDTRYDDGTARSEVFDQGLRVQTTEVDESIDGGARKFQQLVTQFDAEGAMSQRDILFDNGVQRVDEFYAGQRSRTVETDVEDAVNWALRSVTYDANGQKLISEQVMDNGVQTTIDYDAGVRLQRVDLDNAENFNWGFRGTTFDENGVRAKTYTGMDNGDELLDLFEAGARAARVEIDGDGSHAWAARVTDYGADGVVSGQTFYDTLEELPPEYAGEFGLAVVGF